MSAVKHILGLILLMPLSVMAQNITVTSAQGQNPATFVNAQLIGNGVYVWNVKFNNSTGNIGTPQIGTFNSNGYQSLQMDEGVIMATGNVSVAPGPNNSGSSSQSVTGAYTDSQLGTWTGLSVTSCATLDFDFISMSPFVTVNYCFGSEEYNEYVWSSYNDVFAFLVTGPDPVTGQSRTWNCAIIPHTVSTTNPNGIAVAINTVNGKTETENPSQGHYHYSAFYVDNTVVSNAPGVQYDGYTQKLSANATLVPCAQYHMHISVCNVSDNLYDSGVFLEKNSFNSPSADVSLSHRYADTIERSHPVTLPLSLQGSSYTYGRTLVSFGGTALIEHDYTVTTDSNYSVDPLHNILYFDTFPHSLTFAGTAQADLTEPKLIELYLATSLCSAHPELKTYDTIRYILREDDVLRLRDTTIVAYDTCREVGVEVAVGQHQPFTFHWFPEDGIDFPHQQFSTALITESCTKHVAVTDVRGHTDTADVIIEIRETPSEGIDSHQASTNYSVYPNPTDGPLTIEADGLRFVELYSTEGTLVFSRRTLDDRLWIDTRDFPAGVYTLRVTTPVGTSTEKIIISK